LRWCRSRPPRWSDGALAFARQADWPAQWSFREPPSTVERGDDVATAGPPSRHVPALPCRAQGRPRIHLALFRRGLRQGESIDAVRRACGFCAEHIEMLWRIEIDGMKSTLAISTMFADTFARIVEDLESPDARSEEFHREPCPACANRDERLHADARYLLDELATTASRRETFEASPGLCFAHFELVWNAADAVEDRELILRVQRLAARSLLHELREHVRKHDHKFHDEPKGAERDSWLRAIHLTAGRPSAAESAAEPERR
jgi:Family of unknown function (DUF6062)